MGGVEVPQAPRGCGHGEGVSPSPLGKGLGVAPPQNIFHFFC